MDKVEEKLGEEKREKSEKREGGEREQKEICSNRTLKPSISISSSNSPFKDKGDWG